MLNVSPQVAIILYEAYAKISGRMGRDHYTLYDYVRVVMSKICRVDAFYVGLLYGGNRVRFPYSFDGEIHDDSDTHTIGRDGLTAWLQANRRTYTYGIDGGSLLNKGISFGDVRRVSADAVTAPMIRQRPGTEPEVLGMLSMQSYASNAYDQDAVSALEWLAEIVSRILLREREDRDALHDLKLSVGDEAERAYLTSDHIVEYLVEKVGEVRRRAEKIVGNPAAESEAFRKVMVQMIDDCRSIQAELIEMTLLADDRPAQRFASLTPTEQTIVLLLADGLTNQQIADELAPTSVNTVKTHLASIREKYGMSDRSAIARDVRWHLGRTDSR